MLQLVLGPILHSQLQYCRNSCVTQDRRIGCKANPSSFQSHKRHATYLGIKERRYRGLHGCRLGIPASPTFNVGVCGPIEWRAGGLERQEAVTNRIIDGWGWIHSTHQRCSRSPVHTSPLGWAVWNNPGLDPDILWQSGSYSVGLKQQISRTHQAYWSQIPLHPQTHQNWHPPSRILSHRREPCWYLHESTPATTSWEITCEDGPQLHSRGSIEHCQSDIVRDERKSSAQQFPRSAPLSSRTTDLSNRVAVLSRTIYIHFYRQKIYLIYITSSGNKHLSPVLTDKRLRFNSLV